MPGLIGGDLNQTKFQFLSRVALSNDLLQLDESDQNAIRKTERVLSGYFELTV